MSRRIIVPVVIVGVLMNQVGVPLYGEGVCEGECCESEYKEAGWVFCQCRDNECLVDSEAGITKPYEFCKDVLPGERGDKECHWEELEVGIERDCVRGVDWAVLTLMLGEHFLCDFGFYSCMTGCVGSGPAYTGCAVLCIIGWTACAVASSGEALPDCELIDCSPDYDSERPLIRKVATSLGGGECRGA